MISSFGIRSLIVNCQNKLFTINFFKNKWGIWFDSVLFYTVTFMLPPNWKQNMNLNLICCIFGENEAINVQLFSLIICV